MGERSLVALLAYPLFGVCILLVISELNPKVDMEATPGTHTTFCLLSQPPRRQTNARAVKDQKDKQRRAVATIRVAQQFVEEYGSLIGFKKAVKDTSYKPWQDNTQVATRLIPSFCSP